MTAKLTERFGSNAALEAKHAEGGNAQADEPSAAFWGCPQPRLGRAVSACHRLRVARHAAVGKPGATR